MLKKQALAFVVVLGYCGKKPNSGVEDMEFPWVSKCQRNSMWNFQGLIKNEVEFQG